MTEIERQDTSDSYVQAIEYGKEVIQGWSDYTVTSQEEDSAQTRGNEELHAAKVSERINIVVQTEASDEAWKDASQECLESSEMK